MPETIAQAFTDLRAERRVVDKSQLHGRIVKAAAYLTATFLAILMLTAALPPIVADESDRAILDAPASLLTTPISGEVSAVHASPGQQFNVFSLVAEVTNARVDQTTLFDLESKADALKNAFETARAESDADEHYLGILDQEIAAEKARLIQQYTEKVSALKAETGSAQASFGERKAIHDREVQLLNDGVISEGMVKPVTQQMAAADSLRASASAQLAALTTQFDAIQKNIFIGDDLIGEATIAQKRRDVAFDQTRKAIEETQAKAALENAMALVSREKARVASLEETKLQAPPHQEILNVNVLPGRYVNAGDSLVTLVNCKNLFAVAIFSYRQASSLAVGTRITISGDGIDNPVGGSVQDIIPKSNEKTDDLYAVSFPQTERREMYVVVKPDDVNALRLRNAEGQPEGSCPVGKWITVSRAGGWIPSTSVLWHAVSNLTTHTIASIFASSAVGGGR